MLAEIAHPSPPLRCPLGVEPPNPARGQAPWTPGWSLLHQTHLPMYVGALELDILLGDVHSLKQKRSVVRPVIAELRRKYEVSVAEAGHLDLHRRALIGVAVVAADTAHVRRVLESCERLVAGRAELELLSARQRVVGPHD